MKGARALKAPTLISRDYEEHNSKRHSHIVKCGFGIKEMQQCFT